MRANACAAAVLREQDAADVIENGFDLGERSFKQTGACLDSRTGECLVQPLTREGLTAGHRHAQGSVAESKVKLAELDCVELRGEGAQPGAVELGEGGWAQAGATDFRAWKTFLLDEEHARAGAGQSPRGEGAGRPGPDHDCIPGCAAQLGEVPAIRGRGHRRLHDRRNLPGQCRLI